MKQDVHKKSKVIQTQCKWVYLGILRYVQSTSAFCFSFINEANVIILIWVINNLVVSSRIHITFSTAPAKIKISFSIFIFAHTKYNKFEKVNKLPFQPWYP